MSKTIAHTHKAMIEMISINIFQCSKDENDVTNADGRCIIMFEERKREKSELIKMLSLIKSKQKEKRSLFLNNKWWSSSMNRKAIRDDF